MKWYKKGLDTWHLQNKCNEFINNTDTYFTNFDLIKNDVSKENIKQYQTLDHGEIKQCLPQVLKNKKVCTGRGRFIKKIRDDMFAQTW